MNFTCLPSWPREKLRISGKRKLACHSDMPTFLDYPHEQRTNHVNRRIYRQRFLAHHGRTN